MRKIDPSHCEEGEETTSSEIVTVTRVHGNHIWSTMSAICRLVLDLCGLLDTFP